MAKLSVSVPDELWSAVRARRPDLNPSQLVQTALRERLDQTTNRPRFATKRPEVGDDLWDRAVSRLGNEARELYVDGFQAGLKLGETLPWRALDRLSDAGWQVGEWVQQLGEYDESTWDTVLPKVAGDRGEFWPEPTFRLGLIDALKSLWEAVASQSASSHPFVHEIPTGQEGNGNE